MIDDGIAEALGALKMELEAHSLGHLCYARACIAHRMAGSLLCTPHWSMLPVPIRRKIIRAYGRWHSHPNAHGHGLRMLQALNLARQIIEATEHRELHTTTQRGSNGSTP